LMELAEINLLGLMIKVKSEFLQKVYAKDIFTELVRNLHCV
jgi:hypothetical protein